jgi:hypothetical protein
MIDATMDLIDYVEGVRQGKLKDFVRAIRLPDSVITETSALYTGGENQGIEIGRSLTLNHHQLTFGALVNETATGITFPTNNSDDNFGDIHSHPSSSIGYEHGYCAHSEEDIISMEKQTKKPIFIRTVGSKNRIYAVVFLRGRTREWKAVFKKLDYSRSFRLQEMKSYFYTHSPEVHSPEDMNDKITEVYKNPNVDTTIPGSAGTAIEQMQFALYSNTPGYGKFCERLSIDRCKGIARVCQLGFYMRKEAKINESSKLVLQE